MKVNNSVSDNTKLLLRTRRQVLVASWCALTIFSRIIFSFVPGFSPFVGMILVSGAALGPVYGLIIGMLSALGSNFFFGQGVWTVWQMVSYGIGGLLAGYFYSAKKMSKLRFLVFCVVSVIICLCVTGPILDASTYFFMNMSDAAYLKACLLGGIPFNCATAVSTVITELLLGPVLLSEVVRLKEKYGI